MVQQPPYYASGLPPWNPYLAPQEEMSSGMSGEGEDSEGETISEMSSS